MMKAQFTLFYDGQFWCGIYETLEGGELRASRVVFGPEPNNAELYAWFHDHGSELVKRTHQSTPVPGEIESPRRGNPKRLRRQVSKQQQQGPSSKAQLAMKLNQELHKVSAKKARSHNKKEEKQRRREQLQEKKKAKRKGK